MLLSTGQALRSSRKLQLPLSFRMSSTAAATANAAKKVVDAAPLVLSVKQAASLLEKARASDGNGRSLKFLDATWFMPNVPRNAKEEFQKGPRIPGAQFWDVDEIASHKADIDDAGQSLNPLDLKHMMPSANVFARHAGALGITPSTHVIAYDTHGVFSSPRTAFTFFAFGHSAISILDGGLPAWHAEGLLLEQGKPVVGHGSAAVEYPTPKMRQELIRSYDEMVANARMGARGQTVLDARPAARFDGTAPEPRPGLSSGHMPNAISLPATDLLDKKTLGDQSFTTLKQQTDLWRSISSAVGGMEALDKLRQASSAGEPAATNTCGSGMTAAILWLGLNQLGIQSSIYDESWTGYAMRKQSVIEKTTDNEQGQ